MALQDFLNRAFNRPRLAPTQTLGAPGFLNLGGYLASHEVNPKLRGSERYVTYSNMLVNTSIVAAGTRYFLGLVAKAGWKLMPAEKDNAEAERIAEDMQKILDNMETPWSRVARRAAMYRFYGFSIQEWTAARLKDGVTGLKEIAPRPQHSIERWDTDENGRVRGVEQRVMSQTQAIYLPRGKILYLVDDSLTDSPEGLGLFRHLVEPSERLRRFEQLEAFGYETDLRGIPVGRAPLSELQEKVKQGLAPAEADKFVAPLRDFIEKHIKNPALGLLLDSITYQTLDEKGTPSNVPKWDLKLVTGDNANSTAAVASAIERLNREMARIMGVEHLLLGGDGKGSLALSRDKTQSFGLMVDGTLTEIGEQASDDIGGPLCDLNGWPRELKPRWTPQPTKYRDVEQVTSALKQMADAGAVLGPEDPAINEVRELLGLSAAETVISPTLAAGEMKDKELKAQADNAERQAQARAKQPTGGSPPGGE